MCAVESPAEVSASVWGPLFVLLQQQGRGLHSSLLPAQPNGGYYLYPGVGSALKLPVSHVGLPRQVPPPPEARIIPV